MGDDVPHDQLIADLKDIGIPDAPEIATKTDIKTHVHSKLSVKVKTEQGVLIFENGILTKIDK